MGHRCGMVGGRETLWLRAFGTAVAVLVVCHLAVVSLPGVPWQLQRLFHLDLEGNIPTWFTSSLWLLAAVAALRCAGANREIGAREVWWLAALAFAAISCDEVASIHEGLDRVLRLAWTGSSDGSVRTVWPLVVGPVVLVVALAWWRRARRVLAAFPGAAWWIAGGLIAWMAGVFGLELLSNATAFFPGHAGLELLRLVVEESLEMAGAIAVLAGLGQIEAAASAGRSLERA